ncbi:hypothetical protein P3T18_006530 [Paraburkholderia sp. GAS199]|uniref:DUF3331 domain-containing protein n=1 Tax=Paraburkholderia sp. GAS199 TaxID=3035126 RepID=UPI003D1ABE7C
MNTTEVRNEIRQPGLPPMGRLQAPLNTARAQITGSVALPAPGPIRSAQTPADPWSAVVTGLSEFARRQAGAHPVAHADAEPGPRRRGTASAPAPCRKNDRQKEKRTAAAVKREQGRSTHKKNVRVSFVERLGARSISITWHDSTAACYGEQLWMRRTARSSGLCALTGMLVRRGDAVYSPASRASIRPLNCTQMILATAVEVLEHS